MPQLSYVEKATRSPTGCIMCGTQAGPFIDCNVPQITFWTAEGNKTVDTWVYVCVGSEENPGCAVQMGRLTGHLVDTFKMYELGQLNHNLNGEVAELRAQLAKKTLKVDDLISSGVLRAPETADAV